MTLQKTTYSVICYGKKGPIESFGPYDYRDAHDIKRQLNEEDFELSSHLKHKVVKNYRLMTGAEVNELVKRYESLRTNDA